MNVADLIGLVALLTKTVDALRYASARNLNGVITQAIAWAIGVGGTFAVAQTQWASHISVGQSGMLARQGALSLVAIGLAISSGGGVLNDLRSAVDNTNTAAIPPLVGKYVGVFGAASAAQAGLPGAVPNGALDIVRTVDTRALGLLEQLVASLRAGHHVAATPAATGTGTAGASTSAGSVAAAPGEPAGGGVAS